MSETEVLVAIVTILLLFITSTVVIILSLLRYQKKRLQHNKELLVNEERFKMELIQAEIEVQEQTRKTLAADLHDNIGQLLSLTNVTLGSINLDDKQKATKKISDIQGLVEKSIKELRQLSKVIHGEQLIQKGLRATIEQEVTWLERNGFYTVFFTCQGSPPEDNNVNKDLFLYRLLQETLNNAIKHSAADTFNIRLTYAENTVKLVIGDNGIGFDVEEAMIRQNGLGLPNMKKRISLLQGSLDIHSVLKQGTTLTFEIPYP
jgi:two-component system NarL family sensor kinase